MNALTHNLAARDVVGGLYARHSSQVLRVVLSRVRDQRLAEDLTAETFVRALRATESTTAPITDPRAWLDTIALNLVRDHYRSSRYRREITTGDLGDSSAGEVGPEQSVIDRETNEELRRCVEQLPPRQRECIQLRFWRNLPVAQTAAAMGCSVGTVKAQQHRAITKLRAAMTAESPPVTPLRDTAQQLAVTRDAVTEVHQLVTCDDHHADDRARAEELTRWHTGDPAAEHAGQCEHDRDALATGGAA